jgi:peptide/nickel transport system ATP-binding protein
MDLLRVEELDVLYKLEHARVRAIHHVSFHVREGEIIGIVGESGCGKTTIAKAILRILPENGMIGGGKIRFREEDLLSLDEENMRQRRWKDISIISQSAMNSLNPVYTIGKQIVEAIQVHEKTSHRAAWSRAEEAFEMVGLEAKRLTAYPHQLSGGMRQRGMIAMALILRPSLVIADEPTTALDVLVQDKILKEMVEVQKKMQTAMIFITHDIGVVAEVCHRLIVMYAGFIAEVGAVRTVFKEPCHPYTIGLQKAFPKLGEAHELISIPGYPPTLIDPPRRCLFAERCPFSEKICWNEEPQEMEVHPEHLAKCHFAHRADEFREKASSKGTWISTAASNTQ